MANILTMVSKPHFAAALLNDHYYYNDRSPLVSLPVSSLCLSAIVDYSVCGFTSVDWFTVQAALQELLD